MTPLARRVTTACAFLLLASVAARAQEYAITDLGDLYPDDLNESGVVVGFAPYSGAASAFRACVWENGVLTLLPTHVAIARSFPQEATQMLANGINRKGQVVGHAVIPSTTIGGMWGNVEVVAFLYEKGETTFFTLPSDAVGHSSTYAISDRGLIAGLIFQPNARAVLYDLKIGTETMPPTLGGAHSGILDVNDSGVAVGSAMNPNGNYHAIRYTATNGTEDLGTLGGSSSSAVAISKHGVIVGESSTASNETHAVQWVDGAIHDLGTLGGPQSGARDVNSAGTVVGWSATASLAGRAFIIIDGVMTDLNFYLPPDSGWVLTWVSAINDAGQVVGLGFHNGVQHAFLLTPTNRGRR
jgi:probable HAF family extracellular repeat protein